jgi:hypothetical protein
MAALGEEDPDAELARIREELACMPVTGDATTNA